MSSPIYTPISFVSPISERSRRNSITHNSSTNTTNTDTDPKPSAARRLSTYLKNAFTLEDPVTASRRESIISDSGAQHHEAERRASVVSFQDERDEQALLARRRGSVEGFWNKHGQGGRRESMAVNEEGEERRMSGANGGGRRKSSGGLLGLEMGMGGRWVGRKMSWGVRRGSE